MTSVVFLTPSLPLPFGRTDARWLHAVLPGLSARGFDVTCLSCTEEPPDRVEEAERLATSKGYAFRHVPLFAGESTVRRKARSLLRPRSELARCPALLDALEEERPGDDGVLHVEHLFSSWATRRMRRVVTYLHCLEVVDWGERTALSTRERIDLLQMRRATKRLLRSHPPLIAMTDRLATEVERYGLARPPVAPVGIDPSCIRWCRSSTLRAGRDRVDALVPVARRGRAGAAAVARDPRPCAGRDAAGRGMGVRPLSRAVLPARGRRARRAGGSPEDFFGRIAVLLYPRRGAAA